MKRARIFVQYVWPTCCLAGRHTVAPNVSKRKKNTHTPTLSFCWVTRYGIFDGCFCPYMKIFAKNIHLRNILFNKLSIHIYARESSFLFVFAQQHAVLWLISFKCKLLSNIYYAVFFLLITANNNFFFCHLFKNILVSFFIFLLLNKHSSHVYIYAI